MAMLAVLVFPLTILVFTGISSVVAGVRDVQHLEPRTARPLGDPLRLHVGHRQQRVGLRRHLGEHEVVQHDPRRGDADRPFHDDHPDAGDGRESGPEEARAAFPGHFPVTTPLFATLLVGVIVIVGALTFFPVLSLGPIVEHFLMRAGTTF